MFKFTNFLDLIQFFANEWCKPKNNILIIGNCNVKDLVDLFNFINCETFFVNDHIDHLTFVVSDFNSLPFEENSFDVIINLNENFNKIYLKPGGIVLTNSKILNAKEHFYLNNEIFSIY